MTEKNATLNPAFTHYGLEFAIAFPIISPKTGYRKMRPTQAHA